MAILKHKIIRGEAPHYITSISLYDKKIICFKGFCVEDNINRIGSLRAKLFDIVNVEDVPQDVKEYFGIIPINEPAPIKTKKKAKR